MKKLIAAVLALTLFLSLAVSAPAEGKISSLMESLHSLLFSTINVTISGEAVFSLDGERFKTAEILYKQAGEDSHWQLDLKTPRRYRADQETGYTIIANGEKLYVMEHYHPGTYTTGSDQPNTTVISQSTRADLLYSLFLSVADEIEGLLPESALVFPDTEEAGLIAEITLTEETTPALINTSLNLAADFLLSRFMGVNYDSVRNWGQGHPEDYITVTQAILYSTDSFVLGDTSVTISEDAKGRITGISGTVTALLTSEEFSRAPLEIAFNLTVSDYGATEVKPFNPEGFGVVERNSIQDYEKEVDSALAEKLTARAKEIFAAAGYDAASLPAAAVVNEEAGIYYVSFLDGNPDSSSAAGLNENGDLLNLVNHSNEFFAGSPQYPENNFFPEETVNAFRAFLQEAFPDLAASAAEFTTYLEYDYDGEKYQTVNVFDENWSDTGIYMIVKTSPALQVLYYTCLNE